MSSTVVSHLTDRGSAGQAKPVAKLEPKRLGRKTLSSLQPCGLFDLPGSKVKAISYMLVTFLPVREHA